jgi:hypothetical protein
MLGARKVGVIYPDTTNADKGKLNTKENLIKEAKLD